MRKQLNKEKSAGSETRRREKSWEKEAQQLRKEWERERSKTIELRND